MLRTPTLREPAWLNLKHLSPKIKRQTKRGRAYFNDRQDRQKLNWSKVIDKNPTQLRSSLQTLSPRKNYGRTVLGGFNTIQKSSQPNIIFSHFFLGSGSDNEGSLGARKRWIWCCGNLKRTWHLQMPIQLIANAMDFWSDAKRRRGLAAIEAPKSSTSCPSDKSVKLGNVEVELWML